MMKLMMRLMNKFLPTCEEVSRLTSQVMDETLPWRKRIGMRVHIMMCVWCRRNAEQLELVRRLARQKSAAPVEKAHLSDDARDRLIRLLEQDDRRP